MCSSRHSVRPTQVSRFAAQTMFARALFVFAVFAVFAVLASPAFASDPSGIDSARQQTVQIAERLWKSAVLPTWGPEAAHRGIEDLARPLRSLQKPAFINATDFEYSVWADTQRADNHVDRVYNTFLDFLDNGTSPNGHRTLAEMDYSYFPVLTLSVRRLVDMHKRILANESVFAQIFQETKYSACLSGYSQQTLLYNMYEETQGAFLKSFIMANAAWLLYYARAKNSSSDTANHPIEGTPYLQDANRTSLMYQTVTSEQARIAKRYIQLARRDFVHCDPAGLELGIDYEKVQGLLQGFVVNEVDMNPEESCRGGCHNYKVARTYGCHKKKFCSQQPTCTGRILNCKFVESDMKICLPESSQSDRRYEYIRYKKGTLLGRPRTMWQPECNMVTVNSWWRFLLPAHCSYCFCLCEEHPIVSQRYFSLGSSMADTENNKVVTGVRLLKLIDTFYIQVQQGELLPHGTVNRTTLEWVPVDQKAPKFLMSYEARYLDLDDIEGPEGYLMTGIRFRTIGSHLNIEIMVSPFDFEKGLLHRADVLSYWHGNDNTEHSPAPNTRTMLTLPSTDVYWSWSDNRPESTNNSFVQFIESSMETDASQNTIPFIDTKGVSPYLPATILSGAGLYLRRGRIMAGLISPRVFTYDITPHIQGGSQRREG